MKTFTIVKCLVVNKKSEVLLLRRGLTAPRRAGEWDLPGGFVDEGEDLTVAVIRETKEEAGIDIAKPRLVFAMSEPDSSRFGSGNWLTFAVNLTDVPMVTLSYEHDEYKWVSQAELIGHIAYQRQQKMLEYVIKNRLLSQE